jgi:hypothetical protein
VKKQQKESGKSYRTSRNNNTVLTPPKLKEWISKLYNAEFDHDPCPVDRIDKEGKKIDSLKKNCRWGSVNFVNPPYCKTKGKENGIKAFFLKAIEERDNFKSRSIFLVPFALTKYFLEIIFEHAYSYTLLPGGYVRFFKQDGTEYKNSFPKQLCVIDFGTEKFSSSNWESENGEICLYKTKRNTIKFTKK